MANINPIPYYGPAPTDLSGVLSQFVRIPCENSPSEQNGELTYTEKWKGPYEDAKDLLTKVASGYTISQVHLALGANRVERFETPTCPARAGGVWIMDGVQVQELEAGSHAIVTFTYKPVGSSSGGGTDIPEQDVWSLSWEAYQVTPWAFCKNDDYSLESYNWSPSDTPPDPDWSKCANRAYIEQCVNAPSWEIKGDGKWMVWTPDENAPDFRKYLPVANQAIYKKVALQRNATYHHPILVHQTAKSTTVSAATYDDPIGGGIDHITSLPSGCPYSLSGWEWVKTGDDMTQQKVKSGTTTTIFTRRQVWCGYPVSGIDKNYYGNGTFAHTEQGIQSGRWPIGGV